MAYFALFYDVVDDYVARRTAFRQDHLGHAEAAVRRGELVLGGAFTEPVDRAMLVFRGSDRSVAEGFARADPYVTNGLVTNWEVREWSVVIGEAYRDER